MFLIITQDFRAALALKVLLGVFNENVLSIKFVKMNIQYLMKEVVNKRTLVYNIVDNPQGFFLR